MRRTALRLLCGALLGAALGSPGCGLGAAPIAVPASGSSRDGVYDFSFVFSQNGTPTTVVLQQYFVVTNGNISSNPAELSGSVLDDFGNVEFTGPCPVNGGNAQFTGTLNLVNPLGGQGGWTCDIGGASNTWRAYNGYP